MLIRINEAMAARELRAQRGCQLFPLAAKVKLRGITGFIFSVQSTVELPENKGWYQLT